MTLLWLLTAAAALLAGAALAKARRLARRLERLTESYWELRYEHGQLRARVNRLDPEQQQATAAAEPPAEAKVAGAPGSPDERGASVVLAPSSERVAMLAPGRIKPAMPFPDAKGLLPLPVQGKRVLTFGEKTQNGGQSKGVILETRHGAQVVSPSDGWIVYAGEFRSYGQLLIINAGGGYHILLAGLSQIDVQLGQFVLAGEPVGVMSTAAKGPQAKTQENAPILYIEFRKDQRPIDPDPWWSDASRKVQG